MILFDFDSLFDSFVVVSFFEIVSDGGTTGRTVVVVVGGILDGTMTTLLGGAGTQNKSWTKTITVIVNKEIIQGPIPNVSDGTSIIGDMIRISINSGSLIEW